jgi:hypothetical protein
LRSFSFLGASRILITNHIRGAKQSLDPSRFRGRLPAVHSSFRRVLDGRTEAVGVAMVAERPHLLPRASHGFDLADVTFPLVDKQGCAMVKTNAYL